MVDTLELTFEGAPYKITRAAAHAFMLACQPLLPGANSALPNASNAERRNVARRRLQCVLNLRQSVIDNWCFEWRENELYFAPFGGGSQVIPDGVKPMRGYWECTLGDEKEVFRTANLSLMRELYADAARCDPEDMGMPCQFTSGAFCELRTVAHQQLYRAVIVRNSVIVETSGLGTWEDAKRFIAGKEARLHGPDASGRIADDYAKALELETFLDLTGCTLALPQAATNTETKMENKINLLDEAQTAGVRVAASQLCTLVQAPIVAALTAKIATTDREATAAQITQFLGSELGRAIIAGALGAGLTQLAGSGMTIPGIKPELIAAMAKELRITAMELVGTELVEVFAAPLREALSNLAVPALRVEPVAQQAQLTDTEFARNVVTPVNFAAAR
jgi:hypothetical protein